MDDLGILSTIKSVIINVLSKDTMPLKRDNTAAIRLTKNPEFHSRTKHIVRRYHYIRELVEAGDIKTVWIPSKNNLADILTKSLSRGPFEDLRDRSGIILYPELKDLVSMSESGGVLNNKTQDMQ